MPTDTCTDWQLLIQADIDGELPAADAARVAHHIAECAACAALQARMLSLRGRLRAELPRHPASATMRAAITARAKPAAPRLRPGTLAGLAIAASLLLVLPLVDNLPGPQADLVSAHLRALQPGHLTDVLSTDQHTVKPWFDGRLSFTPLVKDLAGDGFALVGGRLEVIAGQQAAAMVYRRHEHMIDVFAMPADTLNRLRAATGIGEHGQRDGYAWIGWQDRDISYWAVSSVDVSELRGFVSHWQRH